MQALGYAGAYFGLPYRQTQSGMVKAHAKHIPDDVPDYSTINRRVNKLDIKINQKVGNDVVIAIDSTGIKVVSRDQWIQDKWNKRRGGFLKIHVTSDVKTKKILSIKVTDGCSLMMRNIPPLSGRTSREKRQQGNQGAIADGAYDSKDNFSYCYYDKEAMPAIKARKTSSTKTDCYPRRKSVLAQLYNLMLWNLGVSYGDRWSAEGVCSRFCCKLET